MHWQTSEMGGNSRPAAEAAEEIYTVRLSVLGLARPSRHQGSGLTSLRSVRTFLRLACGGTHLAQVAELVDALVSGTSGAIRGGSSPLLGTIRRATSGAASWTAAGLRSY